MRRAGGVRRWLSSSVADSALRMMLQLLATVLLARRLAPEVFGEAALALVATGLLTVLVTAPFEEALTQARRIRRAPFAAALGVVLVLALAVLAVAPWLADAWLGERGRQAAPFAAILLFAGPVSVLTALARRQRRFALLAAANSGGQLAGTAVGLALVFGAGAELWGLLAIPLVARAVTLVWLAARLPVRISPSLRWGALRGIARFAGWHLAGRVIEALGDALHQALVTAWFGLAGNGYLNMAMRIVEPLRGASGAIGHNVVTALFAPAQAAPERFRSRVSEATLKAGALLLPAFVGLAVVAPALMALVAGPGWAESATLARWLALGAAFGVIANILHSALAAQGRAEVGVIAGLLDTGLVVAVLALARPLGIEAAGLARGLPYLADLLLVGWLARRAFGLPDRALLLALARLLGIVMMMAAIAGLAIRGLQPAGPLPALALAVPLGVLVHALGLRIALPGLWQSLNERRSAAAVERRNPDPSPASAGE